MQNSFKAKQVFAFWDKITEKKKKKKTILSAKYRDSDKYWQNNCAAATLLYILIAILQYLDTMIKSMHYIALDYLEQIYLHKTYLNIATLLHRQILP